MGLRRLINRHRHGGGRFGFLFEPHDGREWVSLDLETTGLDPGSDHILSIAAVPVQGRRLQLSQRFERVVRPDRGFGIDSIRHHRIIPAEAAAGAPVRQAVEDLLLWLRNRPLLGYHLGFDLAMLAPHIRAITGFSLPNTHRDLARDYLRLARRAQHWGGDIDIGLETIAARLGVPVLGRHTALGDATTVALCWIRLQHAGLPSDTGPATQKGPP